MEEIKVFYSEDKAEQEGSVVTERLKSKFPEQNGKFTKDQYDQVEHELHEEQVELIKKLSQIDVPVYLVGGYASDLSLKEIDGSYEGDFLDPHTDIDMVVNSENSDTLKEKLRDLGYKFKDKKIEGQDKANKFYLKNPTGIQADFAILETDEKTGELYFNVKALGKNYRMYFDNNILDGQTITLGDTPVKVVSPPGLIQTLLFYKQIGIDELREKDRIRAERLREKYFPNTTLDSDLFKVRLVEIGGDK